MYLDFVTKIIKYILITLIVFSLWVAYIHYCFIPFYKSYLRHKIREYIIQSRLDNSGRQIRKDMVEPENLLQILQTIEKLFGLDDKPMNTVHNDEIPSKCIFTQ